MRLGELLKTLLRNFFVITTGTTVSMYIFCLIISPDVIFTLEDIGGILLMAVASDLLFIIFYSRKELDKKQMRIRFAIHLPVLLVVLLLFAYIWDWVKLSKPIEVVLFILLVMGVYVVVFAIGVFQDKKTADKLNDGLKKRYHS